MSATDAQTLAECVRRVVELAVEDEQRTFCPDQDQHRDLFGLTTELGGVADAAGRAERGDVRDEAPEEQCRGTE